MSLSEHTVEGFLAAVASREPAPGGGSAAAITVAAAAGLAAMAARFSAGLPGADATAVEADELRVRVTGLADADAAAYGAVLAAYRSPQGNGRRERIRDALRGAVEPPLRIAAAGARVAELAAGLAARGNPNLLGDAHAGVLLAEAATRAAAKLVAINVELGDLDGAPAAAAWTYVEAAAAASRTLGEVPA